MSCDTDEYNYGNASWGTTTYGSGSSPYLDTQDEVELLQILQSTLPSWLFEDCPKEIWYSYIKMFALVKANIIDQDYRRTFIKLAESIWLNQHARDHGTYRQPGESDATLRIRLRHVTDSVTVNSIIYDGRLRIIDSYGADVGFTATYEVIFTDQNENKTIAGIMDFVGTSINDGSTPKSIVVRSIGAGTYDLYRTATNGNGGTGLIGSFDGTTAYDGYGTAEGYGNILDEGFTFIDNGQTATTALPDTSDYGTIDLGIVKKLLNDSAFDYNINLYPGFVELGLNQMFWIDNDAPSIVTWGFWGRGERYWNKKAAIVIIIPWIEAAGVIPIVVDSIKSGVSRLIAAGVSVFVESDDGNLSILY